MSTTIWVLLALAGACHLASLSEVAGVFVVFGVVFKGCMYFSTFSDSTHSNGAMPVAINVNPNSAVSTPNAVPQATALPEERWFARTLRLHD